MISGNGRGRRERLIGQANDIQVAEKADHVGSMQSENEMFKVFKCCFLERRKYLDLTVKRVAKI